MVNADYKKGLYCIAKLNGVLIKGTITINYLKPFYILDINTKAISFSLASLKSPNSIDKEDIVSTLEELDSNTNHT